MYTEALKILAGILIPNATSIKISISKSKAPADFERIKGLNQPPISIPWKYERFIWPTLYSGIGYASYIIYKEGGGFMGPAQVPLLCYGTHLAVNSTMCMDHLSWGWFQMFCSTSTAAFTSSLFFDVSPKAGCLFLPYICWLTYYLYYLYYLDKYNTK